MRVVAFIACLLLAGCSSPAPLAREAIHDDALREIVEAFDRRVEEARADPDRTWHDGWVGNVAVIVLGPSHCGLCYHWQEWVYTGVRGAATRYGWRAEGIALNVGRPGEHHAVLVYDPRRLPGPDPLAPEPADEAYVLDAWRRGSADVYRLADWLSIPAHRGRTVEREDLESIPILEFLGPS